MSWLWFILRSSKTELKIVLASLAVLFIMPLLAVVVIANAGINEVASALARVNPVTHLVDVLDAKGNLVAQINLSTVWPVNGQVTTEFGAPDLPYQLHHTGIDIANRKRQIGDSITPFMIGHVMKTGTDVACGNFVNIDHGNNISSLYCHLSQVMTSSGKEVKPGDIIGLMGSTGYSTGPHLHFEIRIYGVPVNPRTFMVGSP